MGSKTFAPPGRATLAETKLDPFQRWTVADVAVHTMLVSDCTAHVAVPALLSTRKSVAVVP
jgi:hypothetical protein